MPNQLLPVAVLDANILYPQFLRDVMLRVAAENIYLPHWSAQIHSEWIRNVHADLGIPLDRLRATQQRMDRAFPGASIPSSSGDEPKFPTVHVKDRHVATTAYSAHATHLVTWNLKHFSYNELAAYGIQLSDPDTFLAGLFKDDLKTMLRVFERHRQGLVKPPLTMAEYRRHWLQSGLTAAAAFLP